MKIEIVNRPKLDPGFIPLGAYKKEYEKEAATPLCIALESPSGVSVMEIKLRGTEPEDLKFAERMAKTLLWQKGGFRFIICGEKAVYEYIKAAYSETGTRAFDVQTMKKVYQKPFEVRHETYENKPVADEPIRAIGRHLDGCRIGFDAGGSDRKVSAVINGEAVYSEEIVWHPKTASDPAYHFNGILESFKSAAEHMPRVDGIGVSSAGIYVENKTALASLFLSVSDEDFDQYARDIYLRAAKEMGDVPIQVCNDGDVTALAGSMVFKKNALLGIAMGTSEAAGYVGESGNITGWLNELAFVPVDMNADAMQDEWSGDIGCGVKYFSQDAVIKLAGYAGLELPDEKSPAEKLKIVQEAAKLKDEAAIQIFSDIGCYLGHTLAFYSDIYDIENVLLLGRVMSGIGGDTICSVAKTVLEQEYSNTNIEILLPNEYFRRVGQSIAAASLPEVEVK